MGEQTEPATPGRVMRTMQRAMPRITPWHVRLYRLFGGRFVGKATGGAPVVLVTTTGCRTGRPRTVPLGHLREGHEAIVVADTNGGLPAVPSWVSNLRADPRCEVEVGKERYDAVAELLEGDERDRHWARLVEAFPAYEEAQRYAGRTVPLVRLVRVGGRGPVDRSAG